MQSAAILLGWVVHWEDAWARFERGEAERPLETWRKGVPGRKTGHFKALRWAHTWYVGGRKGDQRWNENKSRKTLQTMEGHAFYSEKSRAMERGFWAEEWLDSPDLPLIRSLCLFVRTDWREQVEKQGGLLGWGWWFWWDASCGDGDVRWESEGTDSDYILKWSQQDLLKVWTLVWEKERSWGWLQSCWPFWRKEFSTGMKDCR